MVQISSNPFYYKHISGVTADRRSATGSCGTEPHTHSWLTTFYTDCVKPRKGHPVSRVVRLSTDRPCSQGAPVNQPRRGVHRRAGVFSHLTRYTGGLYRATDTSAACLYRWTASFITHTLQVHTETTARNGHLAVEERVDTRRRCCISGRSKVSRSPEILQHFSIWKKRSERRKHCALAAVRVGKNFVPPQTPFPEARDGQNLHQLEMVTTFTYKPSLVKIEARNFELSW